MLKIFKNIKTIVYDDILRRNKKTPFIIFASFLFSFIISRAFIYFFEGFNILNGISRYNIHHFFFGIILIVISNWIALVSNKDNLENIASMLFGFGLGLIADEIGLFLTCGTVGMECDYWVRATYTITIIVVFILLAIIYFAPFLRAVKQLYGHVKTKVRRKK